MEFIPKERKKTHAASVGITELRHLGKALIIKVTASASGMTFHCQHPETGHWHPHLSEIMSEDDERFWYKAIFLEDDAPRGKMWITSLDRLGKSNEYYSQFISRQTAKLFDKTPGQTESWMRAEVDLSHLIDL